MENNIHKINIIVHRISKAAQVITMSSLIASYSDQPLFTLKQVVAVCQHMLKEREEQVREDYNKVLTTKLAGQIITSSPININATTVCT